MSIASENELIDRMAACIRFLGCDPDDAGEYDEQLQYADGHSGEGWYLGCASYPDEGAEFIAPAEYGALLVAQAIVAEERAVVAAATSPTEIEQRRGARSLGGSSAAISEPTPRPQRAVSAVTSPVRADAYLLQERAPVSFVAQLMALGDATFVAESCSALGSQPVMLFTADVDEVRKTGALFHTTVRLTAEGGGA